MVSVNYPLSRGATTEEQAGTAFIGQERIGPRCISYLEWQGQPDKRTEGDSLVVGSSQSTSVDVLPVFFFFFVVVLFYMDWLLWCDPWLFLGNKTWKKVNLIILSHYFTQPGCQSFLNCMHKLWDSVENQILKINLKKKLEIIIYICHSKHVLHLGNLNLFFLSNHVYFSFKGVKKMRKMSHTAQ